MLLRQPLNAMAKRSERRAVAKVVIGIARPWTTWLISVVRDIETFAITCQRAGLRFSRVSIVVRMASGRLPKTLRPQLSINGVANMSVLDRSVAASRFRATFRSMKAMCSEVSEFRTALLSWQPF